MGTNCAPLVANLLLFCYERDFMMSLSDDKQADIIDVLWSPAGKGLNSCLSFVMSNCDFDTFPLVSWVRFGA